MVSGTRKISSRSRRHSSAIEIQKRYLYPYEAATYPPQMPPTNGPLARKKV